MLGLFAPARAFAASAATLTITGSEQALPGGWDSGTITISFNSYSETVSYGQYSTPASIAAGIAAKFSADPVSALPRLCTVGVCAKAIGQSITFQLSNGGGFSAPQISLSGAGSSFSVDTSGWPSSGPAAVTAVVPLAPSAPAAPVTPAINWVAPAAIGYGTPLSGAQLNASTALPGTFVYSPAAGTLLPAGGSILSVTFIPSDTVDYTAATATVGLVVNKATPSLNWAAPAALGFGTALSAAQLNASASVPGTFVYTPAAGTVPAAGSTTLSVTFIPSDSVDYSTVTGSVGLVVNKAVPSLNWITPAAISYGTALSAAQLDATASVTGTFVYSPAPGAVPAAGSTTLSVTFVPNDSNDYSTVTAGVGLVVNQAAPIISWATPTSISYGTALSSAQLDATASVPGTFAYSPAAGTVPAAGTDTLSVTFTPADARDFSTATASVPLVVTQISSTVEWNTPPAINYGTALSASQLNATSSIPGTFVYSPAAGTVLSAGINILSVTFTPTNPAYAPSTATVSLAVNKLTPTVTWGKLASIAYGTALSSTELDATASTTGTFTYSPAAGTILTAGQHTLSVTFTPANTIDYVSKTATVTLTVNKASPSVSWATPTPIVYGTALSANQLNATSPVAGIFTYTPALGTILTTGTTTLSVTFTPSDTTDYTTQIVAVSLTVNQATPNVSWPSPAPVILGTLLSSAQLDATASVPGTFVYTPSLGAVLLTGLNTLSVTFIPTDSIDYASVTSSVTLTVQPGTNSTTSVTNIDVGSTVIQTGMKRLGMNIGSQTNYDSGQMLRNLTFGNSGFEAEMWQSILHCVVVTPTSCTDANAYAVWPANFLQGATFQFIYGGANGETGTISSSTAAVSSANLGVTINFPQLATPPLPGDFVIVKMSVPGNGQAGWSTTTSGGATIGSETTDISPNSPGQQALTIAASGSGQTATVISYFDSLAGRSFVQLNGTYQIAFRAKGLGGTNQVTVTAMRTASTGNEIFFNQVIPLSSSWQDYSYSFTANETGNSIGTASLRFTISGANILLDDASLTEAAAPTNPTPFRNAVVSTLQALQPGVLRYNDGANMGSSIDNVLAQPNGRLRAGASEQSSEQDAIELGLHEFLQLCQTVGSEPYYDLPPSMSTQEMTNLMQYLGGDSTTPYGALRAARGQLAPWTSVFPVIHLELGNEEWNSIFAGWSMQDPVAYGKRVATIFGAAKQSPYYNPSGFDLVMGSWAVVPYYTGQETANSANYDSISVAPYLFNSLNDYSSAEAVFGPMFAQPESVDSVASGYMYQQAQAAAAANTKVNIYEVQLSTLTGTAPQNIVNAVVPTISAGLTVAEHMMLMMRDLGIKTQNVWALPEYENAFANTYGGTETSPLFGAVVDMGGQSNLQRPVYLAEQLANSAILPTMLATTLSGANPVWTQALSANDSIQLNVAHEIQSFAFTDGAHNRSVVVFNLDRTNQQTLTFTGANAPTGTVTVSQLTSGNLTDSNEAGAVVSTASAVLTDFVPYARYTLQPFSMTVFSWQQ
jgi:hypothetical protein